MKNIEVLESPETTTEQKCAEAVALGKRNKGRPKCISDEERAARAERMANARKSRHKIKREVGT